MLTPSDVAASYQLILGRLPESEAVIQYQIRTAETFENLREALLTSEEFLGKVRWDAALQKNLQPATAVMNAVSSASRPAKGRRFGGALFAAKRT